MALLCFSTRSKSVYIKVLDYIEGDMSSRDFGILIVKGIKAILWLLVFLPMILLPLVLIAKPELPAQAQEFLLRGPEVVIEHTPPDFNASLTGMAILTLAVLLGVVLAAIHIRRHQQESY